MERRNITIADLKQKKLEGKKITMLTAYDYPIAKLVDEAGIDIALVGDSLANVVLGMDSTTQVTMDDMIHHAKAARRGIKYAFLIGDMPFGSYANVKDAVKNATRFVKEAGCDAVKLEGGYESVEVTKAITCAGIPVLGHIGLTPQTASSKGGFKVQGKSAEAARRLIDEALVLEKAGSFAVVLECVPDLVARMITEKLSIFTVSCGAGKYCDAQVLVTNDMLGLFDRYTPKFVKKYVNLWPMILEAIKKYKEEVEGGAFPDPEHSFTIKEEELNKLK